MLDLFVRSAATHGLWFALEELDICYPSHDKHQNSAEWKPRKTDLPCTWAQAGLPLSLMLFVLVMEVLNRLLLWLESRDLLTPMTGLSAPRASLYVDDLVMFVRPVDGDLQAVRAALQIFGQASGLIANLDKSVATPLHCSAEEITRVQQLLSYRIEEFPTRYLGIPLSVYKLRRCEE